MRKHTHTYMTININKYPILNILNIYTVYSYWGHADVGLARYGWVWTPLEAMVTHTHTQTHTYKNIHTENAHTHKKDTDTLG